MSELQEKIAKRRTFAIISHPDAGKTTLTEKLLLYGGAIHLAGSVKSRKANKHAVSDWMEIEKQRGISVTSSVLQFDYDGYRVNILDTPGHQDFSEDTYRTLIAADSAVMLIDAAKGVEPQTKKLFWVCHRRKLPIFTFVNKLDRYGRAPMDLMDEIEKVLHINAYPINWPIGTDGHYIGVYDRLKKQVELFDNDSSHGSKILKSTTGSLDDPAIKEAIGEANLQNLMDDIELLDMAGDEFDLAKVDAGELTPMFFGSAMTNFGVRSFLEKFLELSPEPQPRKLKDGGVVNPSDEDFTA
ncbi:GTP-binding protein, partial [Acidaminococcus fermentans]